MHLEDIWGITRQQVDDFLSSCMVWMGGRSPGEDGMIALIGECARHGLLSTDALVIGGVVDMISDEFVFVAAVPQGYISAIR